MSENPHSRSGTSPVWRPRRCPSGPGWILETTDLGIRIERNVTVPMRDGKLLRVDLYRPEDADGPLPVLVAWSPYGKHGQLDWRYWPGNDVPTEDLTPYTCFETPDPAFWTARVYAFVMADARGTWGSEGNVTMGGPAQAEACYDLIEWAGVQDWSNAKVGMAGVSWTPSSSGPWPHCSRHTWLPSTRGKAGPTCTTRSRHTAEFRRPPSCRCWRP